MKTFVTSDTHFGESRFELMGRPFTNVNKYIDTLIENHNALVAPGDKVIILGDVCYQKAPEFLKYVGMLNGIKTLVRGNHDNVFTNDTLTSYFDVIIPEGGGIIIDAGGIQCWCTHYPTQGREDMFNLVGHIHSIFKYQLNMLNVCVDVHNFRPVDISTIPFHLDAISKYYDEDVWIAYNNINMQFKGKRGKIGSYFNPKKST